MLIGGKGAFALALSRIKAIFFRELSIHTGPSKPSPVAETSLKLEKMPSQSDS